jgi:hypothetical protein
VFVGEIRTPFPFQTLGVFPARAVFAAEIDRATLLAGCTSEFAARGAVVAAVRTPLFTAPASPGCKGRLMFAAPACVTALAWFMNAFCALRAKFGLFRFSQL